MTDSFAAPPAIEAVIAGYNSSAAPFAELDVQQALAVARRGLSTLTEATNYAAWAEILAFSLIPGDHSPSPWATFYGPLSSGTQDGKTVYWPDIAEADAQIIDHWIGRATHLAHPVLKARYADLVWDLAPTITQSRQRNPAMARLAIDAYLASLSNAIRPELFDQLSAAIRALDLAVQINDAARMNQARLALMQLHRQAVAGKAQWWRAYDRLIEDKRCGVPDLRKPDRQVHRHSDHVDASCIAHARERQPPLPQGITAATPIQTPNSLIYIRC
jgi:hypothetical protein